MNCLKSQLNWYIQKLAAVPILGMMQVHLLETLIDQKIIYHKTVLDSIHIRLVEKTLGRILQLLKQMDHLLPIALEHQFLFGDRYSLL